MAEHERLTNKERRERARAERKRKEEEAAQKAKRQRLTSILASVLVLGLIGVVVFTALAGDDAGEVEDTITLASAEAEEARASAGCEVVDDTPLPSRDHFDAAAAPPADVLYTGVRPTHSGSHYTTTHPTLPFSGDQLDERALTHNLEHGAVIAWFDPAQVDDATTDAMREWSTRLNNSGFDAQGGAAIFAAAYEEPGISSGKAIAFRAWGIAMDCDEWDEDAANSFVIDRYGSHGIAPERNFAPYPEEVLRYEDREVGDTPDTEAPTDGETATEGATEGGTPTEGGTATEGGTPTDGATPTEDATD